MTKHHGQRTRLRRWWAFVTLWVTIVTLVFSAVGCSSAIVMAPLQVPPEKVRLVCWDPPEKGTGDEYFVFPDNSDEAVSESRAAFLTELRRGSLIFKFARGAPASSLNLIPLSRTDAWCDGVPKPSEEVQKLFQVCPDPVAADSTTSISKQLLAQSSEPSPHSGIYCNQHPNMTPTTQGLILERALKIAYQDRKEWCSQLAAITTQAKADIDYVTNQDASWLKQALTKDPGTIEQIQQRLADQLNSLQEPTIYSDVRLEIAAQAGCQKGYEEGQFQVEATLFAIDAGVLILETVAFEIAMGPLGGAKLVASAVSKGAKATKVVAGAGAKVFQYTKSKGGKALEAAMTRLGELPIFLPTGVGLPGAVIKARLLFRSSARTLERAMFAEAAALKKLGLLKDDLVKLVTDETHHICAEGSRHATKTRELLKDWGIDINHPANGVFLPANLKSPNPNGSVVHKTLGSNKLYYQKVDDYLRIATSREEVIARLRYIGKTLKDGTFWNAIP
jgi:A nuclease family of the HNH/ENDO VII superfamily with conserved AHH